MKKTLLLLFVLGFAQVTFAYDKTYVVIVSIGDYQQDYVNDFEGKQDDVILYNFFSSQRGGNIPVKNICKLVDGDATRANIIRQAKSLFAKAKKNDRVIFYFSGHGGSDNNLCPYDYDGSYATTLWYDDLKDIFSSSQAGTKLLFIDACHSGAIKGDRLPAPRNKKRGNAFKNSNIAVMSASKGNEYSWYSGAFRTNVFTYYLIEGLSGMANADGNSYVTIQELFHYVYHKVVDWSLANVSTTQTPQLFGKFDKRLIVAKI